MIIGDACYRYISQDTLLCRIIDPLRQVSQQEDEWCEKYHQMTKHLLQVHHLIMRPSPLCHHEVTLLTKLSFDTMIYYKLLYGNPTPKMHLLGYHVPTFAQRHHSVCVYTCVHVCIYSYVVCT
jgi:hypothetical protein